MFGYVRPVRDELKCRDFDLYRATYCGLCSCMRQRYGLLAPMFLNYDFTFLALVLWEPEGRFVPCRGRCHAKPLAKRSMCQNSPALEQAADDSVILTWWKLRDSVQDDGFWKGMPARLLSIGLKGAYRKAAERQPSFDRAARECLDDLRRLELENCPSIDRTADTFAKILQAAAPEGGERGRILGQLFYHLGRWIYLVDARDDQKDDEAANRYNPLTARYGGPSDDAALELTLEHSLEFMGAALQLGDFGCRQPLLENIIYLGLPMVQRAVFSGKWSQLKKQKIWRNDR